MLVAPNGQVFYAGQEPETYYLDTADHGGWTFVARSNFGFRDAGSAVMYDNGKVLIVGGSDGEDGPVTNTAEVIDLNAATPAWHYTSPMAFARKYLNAVALPDGVSDHGVNSLKING